MDFAPVINIAKISITLHLTMYFLLLCAYIIYVPVFLIHAEGKIINETENRINK